VLNTKRPGISPVPGVPSTAAEIDADWIKFVPSAPAKIVLPISSPEETIAFVPIVPERDLENTKFGELVSAEYLTAAKPDEASVSTLCILDVTPAVTVKAEDVPEIALPFASTTNGVASGLALSSTTKALPAPVCVMRNASDALLTLTVVAPVMSPPVLAR
jgi:hypothetical protein